LFAPVGVVAGKAARVTIFGVKLDTASAVKVLEDKGTATIVSKGNTDKADKGLAQVGDSQVVVEITLKADPPAQPVEVVVVTPDGETKPHSLLVETIMPVVKEREPNDGFRQAQDVALPVVVEGAVSRPRDVDVFRFQGKAGQKVTLEVLAARQGSALDSIVTLYGSGGRQIATHDDLEESVDSRLEVTLPADDTYFVVLLDAQDTGSAAHVYWLVMK
jgi:hypothetical protein